MSKILFLVEYGNVHVVVYEINREAAKRAAKSIIGDDPDKYIVNPLTEEGDRVFISSICLYA